jgi:hypothetical protein
MIGRCGSSRRTIVVGGRPWSTRQPGTPATRDRLPSTPATGIHFANLVRTSAWTASTVLAAALLVCGRSGATPCAVCCDDEVALDLPPAVIEMVARYRRMRAAQGVGWARTPCTRDSSRLNSGGEVSLRIEVAGQPREA